jgi:hypothetical protein
MGGGKRSGKLLAESCSNQCCYPTEVKLSDRTCFNKNDKPRCSNGLVCCPICKVVVRKYMTQVLFSIKHAEIDLPPFHDG